MSTAVWPPVPADYLQIEEKKTLVSDTCFGVYKPDRLTAPQASELDWLLESIQETLQSLKAGLDECRTLLAPTENGSTLVLSSLRSEAVKGFVTRNGSRITKGVRIGMLGFVDIHR